jgi:hypothetical protein
MKMVIVKLKTGVNFFHNLDNRNWGANKDFPQGNKDDHGSCSFRKLKKSLTQKIRRHNFSILIDHKEISEKNVPHIGNQLKILRSTLYNTKENISENN